MRLTVHLNWAEFIETKLVPMLSFKLSFHWICATRLSWLTQSEEWHLFVNRSRATTSKWWTPWLLPVLFISKLSRRAVETMSLETSFMTLFDVSKLMHHRPCVLFITLNLTLRWGKCELHRLWSCGLFVLISPVSLYGSIFLISTFIHHFSLLCRLLTEIFYWLKRKRRTVYRKICLLRSADSLL